MKIDEIEIPDIWVQLLNELHEHQPKSWLAGGAVRDLFMGVQPKDLDFFIVNPVTTPNWGTITSNEFDYEGMKHVLGVGTAHKDQLIINLIYIEDVHIETLLESFDFGLCQIAFDGKSIIKTPAFDWDFKYSLMTMRHIDRYQRSVLRYARINQRIPCNLSIPELDRINLGAPNANP